MSNILEIATNVSTPLMVAGFLTGAFFLILRQILQKDLFPALTRQLSADIIRLIIERLFTLALVALVLGFAGFALTIFVGSREGVEKDSPSASNVETVKRIDAEIAYRLRGIPILIQKSRENTNPVAKGNLLSQVFEVAEADWASPMFPEFNKRSVLSLCYDLKSLVDGRDRDAIESAYSALIQMAKESREKYYVHDMYKMDSVQLKVAEDAAESYYRRIVGLRPQWSAP
jgi:hypothetical protein